MRCPRARDPRDERAAAHRGERYADRERHASRDAGRRVSRDAAHRGAAGRVASRSPEPVQAGDAPSTRSAPVAPTPSARPARGAKAVEDRNDVF